MFSSSRFLLVEWVFLRQLLVCRSRTAIPKGIDLRRHSFDFFRFRLLSGTDYDNRLCGFPSQQVNGVHLDSMDTVFYTVNITASLELAVGGYFSASNSTAFDPAKVGADMNRLLLGGGLYTNFGTTLLNSLPNNFQPVCLAADNCIINSSAGASIGGGPSIIPDTRMYEWSGPTSANLKEKWEQYKTAAQADSTLMAPFRFTALSASVCPYSADKCVLLQGAEVGSLFGTYCVPKLASGGVSYISNAASSVVNVDFGTKIGDLKTAWKLTLAMAFGSLVLSLLFLWVLRLCVGVFVWITAAMAFLAMIAAAVLALLYANKCVDQNLFAAAKAIDTSAEVSALFTSGAICEDGFSIPSEYARTEVRAVAYVLFALAAVYLVVMILARKRIKLAIAVNKVASQFVAQNKRSALVPTSQTFIMIGWWALWLAVIVYCVTNVPTSYRNMVGEWADYGTAVTQCGGDPTAVYVANTVNNVAIYRCAEARYVLTWQFWYALFALFWLNAFILGAGDMIVAGAVGVWYFTPNHAKGTLGGFPLRTGIRNTFVYHLGTLALGAFIVGVVRILRVLFFWTQGKASAGAGANVVLRCVLRAVYCFLSLMSRILSFLNKSSFIQTALFGTNFFRSCANAVQLIQRNMIRIGATELVSNLIEFSGLVFISASTGFIGWALLLRFYDGEITSPILPVGIFCIIGFAIGLITISLYSITTSSIIVCFLADDEMHRTEGGAKFTPTLLQRFLSGPEAKELEIKQSPVISASPSEPIGGQPITIVPSS